MAKKKKEEKDRKAIYINSNTLHLKIVCRFCSYLYKQLWLMCLCWFIRDKNNNNA